MTWWHPLSGYVKVSRSWWCARADDDTYDPPQQSLSTNNMCSMSPLNFCLCWKYIHINIFCLFVSLVIVPSFVLLRIGSKKVISCPGFNLMPFTCKKKERKKETTCTRFKHSFISIKACCSVRNMFLITLPRHVGFLSVQFLVLSYHLYIIINACFSELHRVASSRNDNMWQ